VQAPEPITTDTKSDQVYRRIRQSIFSGKLAPGEKLVASRVARELVVSNIPVREALKRLEAEGLVTVVPHAGARVAPLDASLLRELYPVRALLEGYAARLAAKNRKQEDILRLNGQIDSMTACINDGDFFRMGRLNYTFHMDIYALSGNHSLVQLIGDIWQKTAMARIVFHLTPERAKASNKEHRDILRALEEGRGDLAERLVVRQNELTLDLLIAHLEKEK
jgi:DNA-binding GntR family transcriptional regulator